MTAAEDRPTLLQERLMQGPSPVPSEPHVVPALPICARELIVLPFLIVVSDIAIFRGQGFAGIGFLLVVVPLLLALGIVPRKFDSSIWMLAPLLALTSIRLFWCGSEAAVVAGFVLLCGYAMGLSGLRPHVLQGAVFTAHLVSAGHRGLHLYSQALARFSPGILRSNAISVILPAITLVVFGAIFIMANPDLVISFGTGMTQFIEFLQSLFRDIEPLEIVFCIAAGWISVGLLRPEVKQVVATDDTPPPAIVPAPSPLYEAYRNTLAMVIGLFGVYLVFEFQTLWFRVFPKGFHYSGYAHEGAAWLTVALALATLLLSMIFRGLILSDPRLPRLRRMAWIWSAENLLLAMAVFNRLFIYVGFNGMTRMRVIGFLGVASVVVGFILVVIKIAQNRDFVWLFRRQLWTVTFAGYLYAVLPVDAFVNEYNVRRILAGDPAPSVQISVHPTTAEGLLRLKPLIHCDDVTIRRGIRALLAEELPRLENRIFSQQQRGWTALQIADIRLRDQLLELKSVWEGDEDQNRRGQAFDDFRSYAYQWY